MTSYASCNYSDVIISTIASNIASVSMIGSTVCSGPYQRKHQSFASQAFARGIHQWPVNSSHKGPVTRKMFPFHDIILRVCHTLSLLISVTGNQMVITYFMHVVRHCDTINASMGKMSHHWFIDAFSIDSVENELGWWDINWRPFNHSVKEHWLKTALTNYCPRRSN